MPDLKPDPYVDRVGALILLLFLKISDPVEARDNIGRVKDELNKVTDELIADAVKMLAVQMEMQALNTLDEHRARQDQLDDSRDSLPPTQNTPIADLIQDEFGISNKEE